MSYSTASTSDAVYIIGGWLGGLSSYSPTIAKFSDGAWSNIGELQKMVMFDLLQTYFLKTFLARSPYFDKSWRSTYDHWWPVKYNVGTES